GKIIALIKPQFEARPRQVGKGGVIRDPEVHRAVLSELLQWALENGLSVKGLIPSPIKGAAGNVEFLTHLSKRGESINIQEAVEECLR
ncbi:MAG: TlyA family rRNA (cytidine-2'-O)-methyltransferase, partial [Chloroflexota bacterium]|nr:TlyA family rRNA (cytidine-2'-O)-methyltransferase [Chloroflexota bacterium]